MVMIRTVGKNFCGKIYCSVPSTCGALANSFIILSLFQSARIRPKLIIIMIVTFELFVFLLHLKISFFEKSYNDRCSNQGCGLGLRTGQFRSVHLARTRTRISQKKITSSESDVWISCNIDHLKIS